MNDQNYPKNLTNIYDPPEVLYIKGDIKEQDNKAIAIVGTRKPSYYGLSVAEKLSYELASLGITIVSGMALGVDTAAHKGALKAGGRTIAVLGTGIDVVYPPENMELYDEIIKNGAVVSELPPGTTPTNWTFPRRNRIISGLSLGVIIVEGSYESGAMITAKLALDQGREVFAIPGSIESELSRGPHWLIKQGAKLVESIGDVLEEFPHIFKIPAGYKIPDKQNIDTSALSFDEHSIHKLLSRIPLHIDELVRISQKDVSQVLILLSQMEIKGFVKQLPGKNFIIQ